MTSTTETPAKTSRPDPFAEADQSWELERLYKDLAKFKKDQKPLGNTEKRYLRGLLCGYGPQEIATKIRHQPSSLTSYLSRTIYQYVKDLTGHEKMQNHSQILNWLENYKKPRATHSARKSQPESAIPIKGAVNVEHGIFYFDSEKNTVNIDIHIHFEASLPETKEGGEERKK